MFIQKIALYIITMAAFMLVFARKQSCFICRRTMGKSITISTFIVVGLLFLSAYGKYDVGRKKQTNSISLALTSIFTDSIVNHVYAAYDHEHNNP